MDKSKVNLSKAEHTAANQPLSRSQIMRAMKATNILPIERVIPPRKEAAVQATWTALRARVEAWLLQDRRRARAMFAAAAVVVVAGLCIAGSHRTSPSAQASQSARAAPITAKVTTTASAKPLPEQQEHPQSVKASPQPTAAGSTGTLRAAVDAAIAGDLERAEQLYVVLASNHPEVTAYREAARILRQRLDTNE